MKCPFRQDEQGEFLDCYGADCMAYCEYTEYTPAPITLWQNDSPTTDTKPVPVCRRMLFAAPYFGGCAN